MVYYIRGFFDPSDFSYFEPTVHTYPVEELTATTASVRAYVMAGTDDIDEQGFEYWEENSGVSEKHLSVCIASMVASGVNTVVSTGQVMTTVLNGLKPATSYVCRAYARTSGGTVYGEEQRFTTMDDHSGVYSVKAEVVDIGVIGYYNLMGRRFDTPQQGINIVLYSDGSAQKVIY